MSAVIGDVGKYQPREIVIGTAESWPYQAVNANGQANIAGYAFASQIRQNYNGPVVSEGTPAVTNSLVGQLNITHDLTTSTVAPGSYWYSTIATAPGGKPRQVEYGPIKLLPNFTR